MDVGPNVPCQTSVVFLTLHDTLLTTRGRRGIIDCFCFRFFVRWSRAVLRSQRGENFKSSAGERQE